jgi:2-oxoglutarate ferredoxin oxidoreductase subunit alpha
VILLSDEIVGHMRESFTPELAGRYRLTSGDFDFTEGYVHPERVREVHPPHELGALRHPHVTGLIHDETGFPTNDPAKSEQFLRELHDKIVHHRDELCLYDVKNEGRGRVAVVAYGSCARSARAALRLAEREGISMEILHLYTLFPLPVEIIQEVARRVEFILIPELNLGQYTREVRQMAEEWTTVVGLHKVDGTLITPREIVDRAAELVGKYEAA